jgi:predicted acetyltransferase
MTDSYTFQRVPLSSVSSLRQMQICDLTGQAHDPLEEHIELSDPLCLIIRFDGNDVGYALIDEKAERGITVLEFFLGISHRKNASTVFRDITQSFNCSHWFVNTQDSFTLPLMAENGYTYDLDCLIFAMDRVKYENSNPEAKITLNDARQDDIDHVYKLIMQDGFYTGDGLEALTLRIKNQEIYMLKLDDELIGVGFVSSIARTPNYADIAMIIDCRHRKQGFAFRLVNQLVQISYQKNLIPTALTSIKNIASRRTLEKCGFYLDGCILLAKLR